MTKQEKIREGIDRIVCEAHDPKIPYEEQSAPLLDWSWNVTWNILHYLDSQGVVIKVEKELPAVHWSSDSPLYDKAFGEGIAKGISLALKAGLVTVESLI